MSVLETAAHRIAVPTAAVGSCRVIMDGNSRLCIENHRGILECGSNSIVLSCSGGRIRVKGEELSIAAMDRESVVIIGSIYCLDME